MCKFTLKKRAQKMRNFKNTNILLQKQKWNKIMINSISKSKVKNYLFMKCNKNIKKLKCNRRKYLKTYKSRGVGNIFHQF